MNEIKIKVITGFRDDQFIIIDGDEAHKAYYLFNNMEKRTIFKNGTALIGKNIQSIEPSYNETMGWNATHKLDDDDWNEIRKNGIAYKTRDVLLEGKRIAYLAEKNPEVLQQKLSEVKLLKEVSEKIK